MKNDLKKELLKRYYYEVVWCPPMESFEDLSDDFKTDLEQTVGYKEFELDHAVIQLGTAVSDLLNMLNTSLIKVAKALWRTDE